MYIYGHIGCNIAVMKSKNVPTIMPSVVVESENKNRKPSMGINQLSTAEDQQHDSIDATQEESLISPPSNPCWYPLSWRSGFPRSFTVAEIEGITGDFAGENLIFEEENMQVYHGILMESPVLVKCFVGSDECFWSELKILAKVRHRNILNLVGYCCTDTSMFLLLDFPCNGSLDKHLQCQYCFIFTRKILYTTVTNLVNLLFLALEVHWEISSFVGFLGIYLSISPLKINKIKT